MRTILSTMLFMMFGVFVTLGCSGGNFPTFPDIISRVSNSFLNPWVLWQGNVSQTYQNIDLWTLVVGEKEELLWPEPDYPASVWFDDVGYQMTMAVTIERNDGGDPAIKYAWLDDVNSPGGGAVAEGEIFSVDGSLYDIASVKVAQSHYSSETTDMMVTFMYNDKTQTIAGDWDIGVISVGWETEFLLDSPEYEGDLIVFDDDNHPDDEDDTNDYHPDIAYDPFTENVYVVWTGYCDAVENHHYRLNYECYNHEYDSWGNQEMIYEEEPDYAAWAPRIAIGNAGPGFGETLGIVYSSYSGDGSAYVQDLWHVGVAYWEVDNGSPDEANFMHFSKDNTNDAGFPRIDLAPRGCAAGDACGSIVFEQALETSPITFDVVEINNIRGNYGTVDDSPLGGFFGAVSIHYPDGGGPEASLTYFGQEQLNRWYVRYGRYLLADDPEDETFQILNTGSYIPSQLTYDDFVDYLTIETFQAPDIVSIYSGSWDNGYWIGFCDKVDAEASTVNVAFGDSTQ